MNNAGSFLKPKRPLRLPFFYGWIVVGVAFITIAIGINSRTAFSLLFPPILAEFGWERGVTAGAFSVGFIVSTLYTPFIGMLMDRFGPRCVISLGVILVSAGMALATTIRQPWHLYLTLGVLVVGGSVFLSYIGHSLFLPNWFVRKRGLAIGIAFSGVGIGSIILFPWLQRLIGNTGWREACWSLALLLLITLLPLNLLLQRQRPEDMGLAPDGDSPHGGLKGEDRHAVNVVDHVWASIDWTLARAIQTARFWWIFVSFFGGLFAWYVVQVHQTKYLIDIGFQPSVAAYALGFVGLTGVVGQITLGHLSDRIGREWIWTLSGAGYVVCYALLLIMQYYPRTFLLYLMVASQGILGYGLASVFGAIPAEIFPGKHYGTIFGTLNLATGIGAALGPWVAGVLYDHTGSYVLAFWLAMLLSLLSIVTMWLAAPRKVRVVAGQVSRLRQRQARDVRM
jgi:MFS family permease